MSRPFADESVYRAVAHPVRRKVLDLLRHGPRPAGEITSSFSISGVAMSQHLRVLRLTGLVQQRRVGRGRIYEINAERLRDLHQWCGTYERLWTQARRRGT
jgi:DNA-binding transcriptional ArsR family regulator